VQGWLRRTGASDWRGTRPRRTVPDPPRLLFRSQSVTLSAPAVPRFPRGPAVADTADAATAPAVALGAPPDLLARLAGVPVYAVVNKKDEFVLVTGAAEPRAGGAGDSATPPPPHKELGLLFLAEAGARCLADKVRKDAPKKVAKDVSVARTTLDKVYALAASTARPAGAERVAFRFVPDPASVERASAATGGAPFAGVPVFQAAGLSVSSGRSKFTPLFLDAADLDEAVRSAAAGRDAAAAAAEAEAAGAALRAAEAAASAAPAAGQQRAAADAALDAARTRATAAAAGPPPAGPAPPVEVGCLEAVLGEMAASPARGPWTTAMLVPPGALAARAAAAAKKGGKK